MGLARSKMFHKRLNYVGGNGEWKRICHVRASDGGDVRVLRPINSKSQTETERVHAFIYMHKGRLDERPRKQERRYCPSI